MIDVIQLMKSEYVKNQYGQQVEHRTTRDVFAEIGSIGSKEFFDAGRNGLNPSLKASMFTYDYCGEKTLAYNGKKYGIYRTYIVGDRCELYAEEKGGLNE